MLEINQIETERLILRYVTEEDGDALFGIFSDRETCLNDGGYLPLQAKDDSYIKLHTSIVQAQEHYALELKETHQVIGLIHFQKQDRAVPCYELGFVLNKDFRKRGYMTEALTATINAYFSQTDIALFIASHIPENADSEHLIKRLGFTFEGRIHKGLHHAELGALDLISHYLEKTSDTLN
ncbi:MAG: GNAT family N-acetyltransferase [Treponema sp.]|nr:GNAT family N-acetyltransferase [Candidatus Treponema caballi]